MTPHSSIQLLPSPFGNPHTSKQLLLSPLHTPQLSNTLSPSHRPLQSNVLEKQLSSISSLFNTHSLGTLTSQKSCSIPFPRPSPSESK